MKRILLLSSFSFLLLSPELSLAQGRTVTGKVTSQDDGAPLPGVNILVKGTTSGTVSDANGAYSVEATERDVLVFSFIGFTSVEVAVGTQTTINVSLASDDQQLSEIVVVAYGTQEKKSISSSVASVNSESFKDQPVLGLEGALQGRAAGVQVTQNSGTPGSGIAVRVRGSSSLTASNEPLYVVDGVPINTGNFSQIGVGNQQTNALSDLNPNDINSIEVLKDAASAALYGSRGANGVVLITTKRGKSGQAKVNVDYYRGVQDTWKQLGTLTGAEFVDMLADGLVGRYSTNGGQPNADGSIPTTAFGAITWRSKRDLAGWFWGLNSTTGVDGATGYTTAVQSGADQEIRDVDFFLDPSSAPSTNWQDEIFQTAPISNLSVSFQGGSENVKYLATFGQFDQEGIIKGSGFKRTSGRLNLDFNASKKLSFSLNGAFSQSINTRINNDNNIFGVLSASILMASDIPVYRANGTYGRDPFSSVDNPLAQALEPTNVATSNRLLTGIRANYDILEGLSFSTSIALDYLLFREDRFSPTTTNQGLPTGLGNANSLDEFNWINENLLNYRKTFNQNHNFSALLGFSIQESRQGQIQAAATGFPGNDVKGLTAGAVKTNASSSFTSWALGSLFTRLTYDFNGKYYFTASMRADESSRFSEDNRRGYFPSASAAWRISEESFMDNLTFFDELKLRASYGLTGNQEIGNFSYLPLAGVGFNFQQLGGLAPTQVRNDNLTWETTTQTDVGLDMSLFKRKLNLSVDYYIKTTEDLLLNRPIPGTSGFTVYSQNVGSIENKGFEVTISGTPIETSSGFSWTTDFNISFNRNEVTALAPDVLPFASGFANWVEAGQPLGAFRGFVVEGIFQTQEEINQLNTAAAAVTPGAVYQSSATRPGDFKFRDLNGDSRITNDDQEILGDAQPDFIGGWNNTFRYKNFDLTAFLQFVSGNEIWNHTRVFSEGMNGIFGSTDGVLNRWTPTNTNTDIPRAVYQDPNNNRRNSQHWMEDGSYVRLKNIVFGYTLPASLTRKFYVNNLRVYAAAQNLFTITDYSGLDPEVNTFSGSNTALGTDFLTFPQARTITFGVNIGF